jgi:hypothetical protein
MMLSVMAALKTQHADFNNIFIISRGGAVWTRLVKLTAPPTNNICRNAFPGS